MIEHSSSFGAKDLGQGKVISGGKTQGSHHREKHTAWGILKQHSIVVDLYAETT